MRRVLKATRPEELRGSLGGGARLERRVEMLAADGSSVGAWEAAGARTFAESSSKWVSRARLPCTAASMLSCTVSPVKQRGPGGGGQAEGRRHTEAR
jgi:hypothetical protein